MIVRLCFGLFLILATSLLALPAARAFLARRSTLTLLQAIFVASRIAALIAGYIALPGLVRSSDLVLYYYPEAMQAMSGQVPYRDFPSSYGPLFPYIAGIGLPVWPHHAAIAAVMVAFEIAAVLLFVRVVRARETAAPWLAAALFAYTCNPAALYWSGLTGYNSSIVLLGWVVALLTLASGRYLGSLLAIGATVIAGKLLAVMIVPAWLADPRRRIGALAAAAGAGVAIIALATWAGLDLTLPLSREGARSTPGNLWFLLTGVLPFPADSVVWRYGPPLVLAAAGAGLGLLYARRWRTAPTIAQLAGAISSLGWLFMIASRKTFPHYAPMFLFFSVVAFAALPVKPRVFVVLAALGALGIIEPGLWNALRQPTMLSETARHAGRPELWALVCADVALVLGSAYFLWLSARAALAGPSSAAGREDERVVAFEA